MTMKSLLACVAAIGLGLAPMALADDPMLARVGFNDGGAMVKGNADADWSYATINTLVVPSDTLWVDKEGTLELELAGGTYVRFADGSKAEVIALPPSGDIRGYTGSFYVQRVGRSTGDVVFETPGAKIAVQRDSQVRVDILGTGATTVTVRWGQADLRGDGAGVTTVTQGRRSYIDPGYLPSEPAPFDLSVEDSFDGWNRERSRTLAFGSDAVPASVPIKSAPIGMADLAPYGEWVTVDSQPYWRPTAVVDFVPYRDGHWSFVPACGYAWVDDYPFCYVTTHYGRWTHHDHYGWMWTYRDTWGPAWVASVRYGPNFVWCPLDPWDAPVCMTSEFFAVGGVHFGIHSSTYCLADDLFMGPCMVHPCTPMILRNVPETQINIWNINIGGHPGPRIPYRDAAIQTRDYAPNRVIRGFDTFGGEKHSARARAVSLEQNEPGAQFRAAPAADRRNVRTSQESAAHSAEPRKVRVAESALSAPRTLRNRADAAAVPQTTGDSSRSVRRPDRASQEPTKTGTPSRTAPNDTPRSTRSRTPQERPGGAPQTTEPSSRSRTARPSVSEPSKAGEPPAAARRERTVTPAAPERQTSEPPRTSRRERATSSAPVRTESLPFPTPKAEQREAAPVAPSPSPMPSRTLRREAAPVAPPRAEPPPAPMRVREAAPATPRIQSPSAPSEPGNALPNSPSHRARGVR